MKQLPTCIVDAFPFLTTHSGIGISAAMMDQFLYLITLGVSFGPYCNSINEMRMSHYWAQHISYLDHAYDKRKMFLVRQHMQMGSDYQPTPFPHYKSKDNYNVILLQPQLIKHLFVQHMTRYETYMQQSFQLHPDESESPDHSFKAASQIHSPIGGQLFEASYDSITGKGYVSFNRFTHTKSNDELRPLFSDYKKVRNNCGATTLLRTEGDGGGDRVLWCSFFSRTEGKYKALYPR